MTKSKSRLPKTRSKSMGHPCDSPNKAQQETTTPAPSKTCESPPESTQDKEKTVGPCEAELPHPHLPCQCHQSKKAIEDLKQLVLTLCGTVSNLEAEIKEQRTLLSRLESSALTTRGANEASYCRPKSLPDHSESKQSNMQGEFLHLPTSSPSAESRPIQTARNRHNTFADSLKSKKKTSDAFIIKEHDDVSSSAETTSHIFHSESKSRKGNEERPDRRPVQNTKSVNGEEKKQYQDQSGAPRVLILHDSTLNLVNTSRIGQSHGLQIATRKAYTIEEVVREADAAGNELDPSPDCIVVHTGINDLKGKEATECGANFTVAIKQVEQIFPRAHIVHSQAIPAKLERMNAKRTIFNAHAYAGLVESGTKASFVKYDNLSKYKHLKDDIHPNNSGAALISRNLGRHLEGLFWQRPRRKPSSQPPRKAHSSWPARQQSRWSPSSGARPWLPPPGSGPRLPPFHPGHPTPFPAPDAMPMSSFYPPPPWMYDFYQPRNFV
jgi:lysophospholipase L1-like esterase